MRKTFFKMNNLKTLRVAYNDLQHQLLESHMDMKNPFTNFTKWLQEAIDGGVHEPNAMNIATVGPNNRPSSRVVLCKEVLPDRGLVFFSHATSKKGSELQQNPHIAANFFWSTVHRQIRVEGKVELLPESEAEEYFNSRSKESRAASACSDQSKVIADKPTLVNNYETMLASENIARPSQWRGYLIKPDYFEFWQGNSHRLHDRIVFSKQNESDNEWSTKRLQP